MATKYKIGDKVVLTSVEGWEKDRGLHVGMEGEIVEMLGSRGAAVSFKGWHLGHTNKERNIWCIILER